MRLTQRLILGALLVVSLMIVLVGGLTSARVLISGIAALVVALGLAFAFSRSVTRPLAELRDVAQALASGELSRRPALTAPGEVGDLAAAVHRMAEQLDSRVEALRAEDSRLEALVESLHEGVIAVDARRQVVRVNDSGRRFLQLRQPLPFSVDLLPRERELREALAHALAGYHTEQSEVILDGRILALTARSLSDGGAVLALYNLTEERRLETVRRDFVANVSHELKTPLTVIGGFAEALVTDNLSATQRQHFAETIQANTRRMQRLIDDLLDLSRIEAGKWVPNPSLVTLAAIAAEATASSRMIADEKGVNFEITIEAPATQLFADPVALRQVIANLADNAVRHTRQGGTVTVFAAHEEAGTRVGVRDTGAGIAEEHLPRIFERFYRVDSARSRSEGGTGLGLAIVRHLVEAHGGSVSASSVVGRGTTVSALFPAAII